MTNPLSDLTVCARPSCTEPAGPRGFCESDYRRKVHMRIYGYRDAGPARLHVTALRELGWTYEQIGETAGLSTYVPHKVATGHTRWLWPESERKLLAIPLKPRDSHRGISSTGTRRRVQALAWMGWPCSEVASQAGTTTKTLATLILPTRQISYALARRVADVYDRLSLTPGPSRIAAGKARQLGFAPPMAWDDDRIDDRRARPRGIRTELAEVAADV